MLTISSQSLSWPAWLLWPPSRQQLLSQHVNVNSHTTPVWHGWPAPMVMWITMAATTCSQIPVAVENKWCIFVWHWLIHTQYITREIYNIKRVFRKMAQKLPFSQWWYHPYQQPMDNNDNYHHNVNASHDDDDNEVSGVMLTMATMVQKAAWSWGCWAASAHVKPSNKRWRWLRLVELVGWQRQRRGN